MVTILDQTWTHLGWQGGTFPTGGWVDKWIPQVTGVVGGSFWAGVLNGQRTDFAAYYRNAQNQQLLPVWFNQNTSTTVTGLVTPANVLIQPGFSIETFTRTTVASGAISVRLVVTDGPVTPPPTAPPCQFGTRPRPGVELVTILTPELIQTLLTAQGWGWLALLFVPLHFSAFAVDQLCATPPQLLPPLTADMIGRDLGVTLQAFKSVAWPYWCECVPGSPAPVPYPPPTVVQPPNWPTSPSFGCDDADICATLEKIRQQVAAIQQTMASQLALTTLLQRYDTPFAYQRGAIHTNLTGEGSFTIPRCVGVEVDVITGPPSLVLEGNPDYWWNQGWMSIAGPDGMLEERRIARQRMTWTPPEMQLATSFAWALRPGVAINVRELYAEA